MKNPGTAVMCLLSSLAVCSGADTLVADAASNPYRAIVVRNVFNLHDPPPPPSNEPPKPSPPKITPTGITTILGNKRALFKVQLPASPPNPAKEQSFIMAEGERQGEIEVLEINPDAGSIKFNNYGTIETKSLEKDGVKPPNTPPPAVAATGMQPPNPVPGMQHPIPAPGVPTVSMPTMKTVPSRQLRLPNSGNSTVPAPNYGTPTQPQANAPANGLPPEAQALMMEIERERAKAQPQRDHQVPPPPPSPITPQ